MRNTTFIRTSGMFTRIVCACRHVRTCTHTRREGRGVYSYLKGEKYDGEWYADKMHGRGRYTYATGKVIDGVWRDDKLQEQGVWLSLNSTGRFWRQGCCLCFVAFEAKKVVW
jgi:hypothetical protein